jgi:O-antigen ligase/Tfp pilus assembly protein PilF
MLNRIGIESKLQLTITIGVLALLIVTTFGNSGGTPWVFFTYRTLLIAIAILSAVGCRQAGERIHPMFLAAIGLVLALMLVSVLRIRGSQFEGMYFWYKYAFFAAAFLGLAKYSRYQSPKWKALLLGTVPVVGIAHLLPDLALNLNRVVGFSPNNSDYFGTFLLIGLASTIAMAVFGTDVLWRAIAGIASALILFGIFKTLSRGATLAAAAMIVLMAIRSRGRIPRRIWLLLGLVFVVAAILYSPVLIQKFTDRGHRDPYNYARIEIWRGALPVIAHNPLLGVGFGQFFHISKRYTLPIDGVVARYLKRSQMAHSEYLQHIAEQGIPAALLLFSLLGVLIYHVSKRAEGAWPEQRLFHEAALLTATGVGLHALVDNCWIIPVTASGLVVLALADPLPLVRKESWRTWTTREMAFCTVLSGLGYVFSTLIPGMGLYYNETGHQAYDRGDYVTAQQYHLKAIYLFPNHPVFLDNLGMVYLQAAVDQHNLALLAPAHTYFARAIASSPQSLEPHIHMETTLLRLLSGDAARDAAVYREIIQVDAEMLEIDPYVPFPRKNLASAYYFLGQPDEAFRQVEQAIRYEPNYVPGYLQLAAWFSDRGDDTSNRRYTAAAMTIVNKYRDFQPTEVYEAVLLGRPTGPSH